jgi:mannitol/fructose-specific phosphotransferase system IIA component
VCSISKVLEGHEVPEKLINRIEAINSCIPKLTDEDLIDEEYIRTVASRKPKP